LLELAKLLGNVSQAYKMMGYSRDNLPPKKRGHEYFTLGVLLIGAIDTPLLILSNLLRNARCD
jgi:hypothetical protein